MKKLLKIALLACALMLLLCIGALAANEPTSAGIYGVTSVENVTITPQKADKVSVESSNLGGDYSAFYTDAVRMGVSISGAENGAYYLLIVTNKATTTPQAEDIVYIDQAAAADGTVSFNVFPSELGKGEYYIYLSSSASAGIGSDGLERIGSFKSHVPYVLGDVDGDTVITANDALWALMMSVDKTIPGRAEWTAIQETVADVDGMAGVSANDALWILEASVDKRTLN